MRPRVLMIGWELPPFNSGGLGVACYGLANALSKKGVHVTFLLPKRLDVRSSSFDVAFLDIDHEFLRLFAAYEKFYSHTEITREFLESLPNDYLVAASVYAQKVYDVAKKLKPDLIHTHDWMTYLAGESAKHATGAKLVSHVHATEYERSAGLYPNPFIFDIERRGFLFSDKVLTVSNITKRIVVDRYGAMNEKVDVIYNGLDLNSPKKLAPVLSAYKKKGYKIVLFLGRITIQKGPEFFVKAAKIVAKLHKKVLFVVAGDGDMMNDMINMAAKEGVAQNFLFTGFVRGEDRERLYSSADVFVLPSVYEPFGLTGLEAISYNVPVIASKQSGVSEVIINMLKVDFWDVEEMAHKILSVIHYKALSDTIKKESKKELPNLTWEKAAEKTIGVYQQVLLR